MTHTYQLYWLNDNRNVEPLWNASRAPTENKTIETRTISDKLFVGGGSVMDAFGMHWTGNSCVLPPRFPKQLITAWQLKLDGGAPTQALRCCMIKRF